MVKPTTLDLTDQTVTTMDGRQVVVEGAVKYEVKNVAILLLEVNSPIDALMDMSKGIIRDTIIERNWEECNTADLSKIITERVRKEANQWGIRVIKVTLSSLAQMRSIRLLQTNSWKHNDV